MSLSKSEILSEVLRISKIHPTRVKGAYIFGSKVYGTSSYNSDTDVILIANNSIPDTEIKHPLYNIHVITPDVFLKLVKDNHIKAFECIFAPDEFILMPYNGLAYKLKYDSLRHNISQTVSNSWVKCKKKLENDEYYIGVKSLFHSLRIADFGIQIARDGKISDYTSSNYIWEEISSKPDWTWDELRDKYQSKRNQLLTEFRKHAEKDLIKK